MALALNYQHFWLSNGPMTGLVGHFVGRGQQVVPPPEVHGLRLHVDFREALGREPGQNRVWRLWGSGGRMQGWESKC